MRRIAFFVLSLLFFNVLVWGSSSKAPTQLVTKIYGMLHNYKEGAPGSARKKAEINKYWLFRDISMDAIQDQWEKMTASQRSRYLVIMKKLLEKTIYEDTGDKLRKGYARIVKQENLSAERAIVRSKITVKKTNMTVGNDYGLEEKTDGWKIRDIYIDGQNLAEDYRSQYNKIVEQYGVSGSPNALLERIQKSLSKSSDWYNISDDDDKNKKDTSDSDNTPHKTRPSLIH